MAFSSGISLRARHRRARVLGNRLAVRTGLLPDTAAPRSKRHGQEPSPPRKALKWLIAREEGRPGGTPQRQPVAELQLSLPGDSVHTLLENGEPGMADQVARRLAKAQHADGSCPDSLDVSSAVHQTARSLRGFLASAGRIPESLRAAKGATRFLLSQLRSEAPTTLGGETLGEAVDIRHLCLLPPLSQAAEVVNEPECRLVAERRLNSYLSRQEARPVVNPARFLACELRALIELGYPEAARPALAALTACQRITGSVTASRGLAPVCAAELAELAICWYETGWDEPADRAIAWLERHQTSSGGFYGSYGWAADYLPRTEHPAAVTRYLDANRLRVVAFMERHARIALSDVPLNDERARAILSLVRSGDRVVEVGCGKGRFLKIIREVHPDTECTGVDISPKMLAEVPRGIRALQGSLERVPYPDSSFDVVFSVEAVEHTTNLEAAVAEMIRIARPGGWIAIIDKQESQWGRLECPAWERWPKAEYLSSLLGRGCDEVASQPTGYDDQPADGLMLIWRGRKRGV